MNRLIRAGMTLFLLCIFAANLAFAFRAEVQPIEQTSADMTEPTQTYFSSSMERLGSGFENILFGPLELPYQFKEEVKRNNYVRGLPMGLARGTTWFVAREVVGVFELVTFFVPLKPHLDPIDTSWLHA